MARDGTKTRQSRMIVALLDPMNRSQEAACKAANVPRRTLANWLADDPEFVAALRAAESELLDETLRRLVSLSPTAVGVIVGVMADKNLPASTRLRSAQMILDNMARLRELHVTEERIAELERQIGAIDTLL